MTDTKLIFEKADVLFDRLDKINTHASQPYSLVDEEITIDLINELKALDSQIEGVVNPNTRDTVLLNELKRVCVGTAELLSDDISTDIQKPEEVLRRFNVTSSDIDIAKEWLLSNREAVKKANRNQMDNYSLHPWAEVHLGSRVIREKAEKMVDEQITILNEVLKSLPGLFPNIDRLADEFVIASDSFGNRSSAHFVGKSANICIGHVVKMYKGDLYLQLDRFLSKYIHEVIGHCYNYMLTINSDLPRFIKGNFSPINSSVRESIASYMEDTFMHVLAENEEYISKVSDIDNFNKVYQRYIDTQILDKYKTYLGHVAVWVLANSSEDAFVQQKEEIAKYSIEKWWPANFILRHRGGWDKHTKILLPKYVSELRYAVDPFSRNKWEDKNKDLVKSSKWYETLVTGFWTPQGFEEWVNFNLSSAVSSNKLD